MKIVKAEEVHVEEALKLATDEYKSECRQIKQLPEIDVTNQLRELITGLFRNNYGVVAMIEGEMAGYLAFTEPIEGFFGICRGACSPLGGSAFSGNDRGKLCSKLLSAAMEQLMKEAQVTSFALSRYANDPFVDRSLVLNGFGIRCSDAVMSLNEFKIRETSQDDITFTELIDDEKRRILDLRYGLVKHLLDSPVFYPTDIRQYMMRFPGEKTRVFAALKEDEVIGFLAIQDEGENFISETNSMINICGAFVKEEYRGKHVADDMLSYVCDVCKREGFQYLGVDCETLNPTALRFWGKYFKNYTYSYHRRIDERVIGYEAYLKKEWISHI
ncbi:GNAT family N-acetyltransferase [Lacrimispora sp. 38-1]|uniref:GNAT family N-acetyltransferase n=1 Tax=Lacrimispora sp. 38-1 TaxID=3125778 RepID=UPI003CF8B7D6